MHGHPLRNGGRVVLLAAARPHTTRSLLHGATMSTLQLTEHSITSLDVIHCADWRVLLAGLPDASVDLCLSDTPYGTTACSWDNVIDLPHWWREMARVMKPRGAVVMTASQPYTSVLVMSNLDWFKYSLVWDKGRGTGFQIVSIRPLMSHEDVLIFGSKGIFYEPQMRPREKPRISKFNGATRQFTVSGGREYIGQTALSKRYPVSIINFSNDNQSKKHHPTQKPVALFEYLIRTYTQPGALVLDPFVGSGTTALAARNTGRHYICGDISREYVDIARERLAAPYTLPMFDTPAATDRPAPDQLALFTR